MKPDSKVSLRETAEKISDKTKALFVKHHGVMHGPSFRRLLTAELAEFRKAVLRDAKPHKPDPRTGFACPCGFCKRLERLAKEGEQHGPTE